MDALLFDWETPLLQWFAASGVSVFSGYPKGTPVWPVTTMTRLGGGPGSAAEDEARARFRVWADKKSAALQRINLIGSALLAADGRVTEMGSVRLLATSVSSLQWAPDESLGGLPSYIMDTTLVFISPGKE